MLTAIASSKEAAERYCDTYIQDQRQLVPTKGTLVVVTSRRRFQVERIFVSLVPEITCTPVTEVLEVWKTEIER